MVTNRKVGAYIKLNDGTLVGPDNPLPIDASGGGGGGGLTSVLIVKSADETVKNSAALQDDDELVLPVGAGEVWAVQLFLKLNGSAAGDIKFGFSGPTGAAF